MAYEQKTHAFKLIQSNVKKRSLKNVILLCGREQFLVNWSKQMIVNTFISPAAREMDYTCVDGQDVTVDMVVEACETLSMFSEKRILEIRDFPLLWANEMKGFSKDNLNELIDYISNIPDGSLLIFTGENPDSQSRRKSDLFKAIEVAGTVYDFEPLDMKTLRGFIAKRIAGAGLDASDNVIREIISRSGYMNKDMDYGLYQLDNDLKKLTAHCSGNAVTEEDVATALSDSLETNVFSMLDAIFRSDRSEAFRLMHDLMTSGENAYKLLAVLVGQLELLLQIKELSEEGDGLAAIVKKFKVHEFRVKKAIPVTRRHTTADFRRLLIKAYEIDNNIKTGFMDQEFALEFFISEI